MKYKAWISFLLLFVLLLQGPAAVDVQAAGILYVKPSGSGDCSNWTNVCTLQIALGMAGAGDEIWLAEGTHTPTDGTDRTATFQMKNGVALYRGFEGTETSRDQRDWTLHETILSGDIGVVGDSSDNSYHVVTGGGTDATAILDGLAITGGRANGDSPDDDGGGMYNEGGGSTLVNIIFSGNSSVNIGGGMYNSNSSPTLVDVTFSGNSALEGGGGRGDLHLQATSPAINAGNNDALPADSLDLDGDGDTTEKLPFDMDGNPRIANGTVDMGAYEFVLEDPLDKTTYLPIIMKNY